MARIAGIDLPREKRVEIGLTYIYGIGRPSATKICAQANVNPDTRVRELTDDEVRRLSAVIDETMVVEGDLRREVALNIKRLRRSAATEVSVTGRACRFAVRTPRTMQEPEKAPRELLPIRRNNFKLRKVG